MEEDQNGELEPMEQDAEDHGEVAEQPASEVRTIPANFLQRSRFLQIPRLSGPALVDPASFLHPPVFCQTFWWPRRVLEASLNVRLSDSSSTLFSDATSASPLSLAAKQHRRPPSKLLRRDAQRTQQVPNSPGAQQANPNESSDYCVLPSHPDQFTASKAAPA
ncbi:hypothetical protein NL676_034525 [Syzygium grande]|nr:hypothetical protein NL676_034525 [Syzygium grande]